MVVAGAIRDLCQILLVILSHTALMEESGTFSYTEIIKTIIIIIMILLAVTFIWHLVCTWLTDTCLSAYIY